MTDDSGTEAWHTAAQETATDDSGTETVTQQHSNSATKGSAFRLAAAAISETAVTDDSDTETWHTAAQGTVTQWNRAHSGTERRCDTMSGGATQ